jgi:hypothetical protein
MLAAAAAGAILTAGGSAFAQQTAAITPPTDPVAKGAFDMLEKHCARCHQDGKLVDREKPAKNFGNVLKLDELAANPHYVLPGNPLGSKLFKQIADQEMPYDVIYEGETKYGAVSEADIKALSDWITGLGAKATASCEAHKFIEPEDMVSFMAADLEKVPRARRIGTRYLTVTHLANVCMDEKAMKVYRQGAVKLLNSLSRSSDIAKLETIDPEETILRFNLADLGWEAADWNKVLAVYPYNVQPDTQQNTVLSSATGTPLPYVRADWFAFTASQPALYDVLLKLPKTFQALAKDLGVDVEGNIRNFVAQRAGFQKSGVSQNNRLIERHPSRSGYFWTSYDFAGNQARQSLYEHPLGPTHPRAFHADGGETIFSLPNGFQGYYLNKASGEQLDKGPTSIVRDTSRKDLAVTNGISCMGCHDQGMRKAKDEIRESVTRNRSFSREDREAVEALYPEHAKMDATIESDGKRFNDAMVRAGLDPTLKLNSVEMINALFKRYEDDIDLSLAAAELGLSVADFKDAAKDADRSFRTLVRRLEQGSVPRDQFEHVFVEFAEEVTDQKRVRNTGAQAAQNKPAVKHDPDSLTLTSDLDAYKVGDTPVFTIVAPKDCFLTLTNIDEKGIGTVLFPNKFQQDNKVRAGATVNFPGSNAPFRYRMQDPGQETVTAVCAEKADGGDAIKHDFSKSNFTEVKNYTGAVARSIAVEGVSGGSQARPQPSQTQSVAQAQAASAPRASFRAAIRLQVK